MAEDWHRADIKAGLEKKGYTIRGIARELGFAPRSAARVLVAKWGSMERGIARVLGVPPEEIWPSRYEEPAAGERRKRQRRSGKVRRIHPESTSSES